MEIGNKDNNKLGTGTGSGTEKENEIKTENKEIKTGSRIENGDGSRVNSELAGMMKKRGRKRKESSEEDKSSKDQDKFFVDVSKDQEQRKLIQSFLNQANNKSYGREIILKDLVLVALSKLTPKDLEKIQENSLSEMERVQRALDEYNRRAEIKLSLGEFLVKKLSLQ